MTNSKTPAEMIAQGLSGYLGPHMAKNAVKTFVGRGGWARLRAPLLRLRYAGEEES